MIKRIVTLIMVFLLCGCSVVSNHISLKDINNYDFANAKEFDFDVNSQTYLLVNMSTFEVEYAKNNEKKIYPASLTKLLTMDAILNNVEDLDNTFGYITSDDSKEMLEANASVAGIAIERDYPFSDLLYALILPSGADGARALENGLKDNGYDSLVSLMNKQAKALGLKKTKVTNSIGLHDDKHYTCLNDIMLVVEDILSFKEGKEVLESLEYQLFDGTIVYSSVYPVVTGSPYILGGKTGYTGEAGQNICVLYVNKGRSYLLITSGAMGNPGEGEYFHYLDVLKIFEELYK